MVTRIKSYLKFLWHSKNEHSVHSPFVFQLLTKGFYNKKINLPVGKYNSKKHQLLFKIIRFFEPKSILFLDESLIEKEIITLGNPKAKTDLENQKEFYDCIYFGQSVCNSATIKSFEELMQKAENDSFWIIENIHSNKNTTTLWELLKQHPKGTVTIDTFHFGLLFFRKEQHKEHFIIRA